MGYYINSTSKGVRLPAKGKANQLIFDGAKRVKNEFQENLVCVVDNGPFEAAAYAFSEDEFNAFNDPDDNRNKEWLVYPHAKSLSGYE